jgi:hypothetical protein
MLFGPEAWYQWVRTVPHTGPLNVHFVRDIGCAYLASAGGVLFFAVRPDSGRPAATVGIAFLTLHGLVHVWDTLTGRATLEHLASDFIGVLAIPLLAAALVFWRPVASVK